jgi:hypothetical protein
MNFASAMRYDAWMYVPLLALAPVYQWRERPGGHRRLPVDGIRMAALFGVLCLPFPLWWMAGNHAMHGDAFYPLNYIDAFHRTWATGDGSGWNEVWLRVQGLGFWPAMAVFTLTPGVAICGMAGMVRAWHERTHTRWMVIAAVAPVVYFGVRTTLLLNFVPLARFAIVQMALLLPFVGFGFEGIVRRIGVVRGRRLAVGSVGLAVLMPAALGLYTFRADGGARDILRPLSPTSTNPRAVMHAARFLATEMAKVSGRLGLDMDPTYQDLQIGFFARVPSERLVRLRWPRFREDFGREPPAYMVRFDGGALADEPGVRLEGRTRRMR